MTRKLFSLTLSAFALLLLMGAGVEEDSAGRSKLRKGPVGPSWFRPAKLTIRKQTRLTW